MSELREALEEAVASSTQEPQNATTETTPASEPTAVVEPTTTDPVSEPEGGAVSGPSKSAAESGDPAKPAAEKPAAEAQKSETLPGTTHRVDRAPASWKKEAKGEWANVPLHIRQEVHRRELEINRTLNEAAQQRQQAEQFQQVVQPYMARIQSAGVTPTQAIEQLLKADYLLATSTPQQKAMFIDKLLQDYGVDIAALDSAISARLNGGQQQSAQQQPDIQAMVQQQLQQALAPLYQQQQQAQQQVQQQAQTTVEQMSLDPQYPHFDELRDEMADLIEVAARRGVALSLQDAYTKAVSLNPTVQQQMSQQQAASQATHQHLQAQKAKTASLSVTGAPAAGGSNAFSGDGSLRGSIEAAFGNLRV